MIGRILLALVLFLSTEASAHAGHDHAEAPPTPPSSDGSRTAAASSQEVELVVRWPARPAGEALPVRVLLSDFATNAPLEEASVELSFSGPAEVEARAMETGMQGIYEAAIPLPSEGAYSLTVTVATAEAVELLSIDPFVVGPPEGDEAHGAEGHGGSWGLGWVVGGALAGMVAGGFVFRRRRLLGGALSLLLLPLGASAHAGHGDEEPAAPAAGDPAAPVFLAKESQFLLGVRTVLAEERPIVDRVRTQGKVVAPPDRQAPIFTPQAGRLRADGAAFPLLGARVRKGEVLGVVEGALSSGERASFVSEAANAKAASARAAAQLEAARRKLERLEGLEGIVTRQELELAQVEVRSAEAELGAARTSQRAFDGSSGAGAVRLVSPIDGVLADIGANPGEMVDPQRRIFLVVAPEELWVEANLFEADLGAVEAAKTAVVTVEAYPGVPFAGSLLGVGQVVDPATRTSRAVFRVSNPEGRLKVGMFADVAVAAGEERLGLVVPRSAVQEVEGRRLVYVRTAPEEFTAREVAVGARDGAFVEIRSGLGARDRVVVSGGNELRVAPRVVR